MSSSYNGQPWNTNNTTPDPPSNPPQQYGAPALNAASVSLYPPRSVVTAAPVSHGQTLSSSQRPPISPTTLTGSNSIGGPSSYDHFGAHQSPVVFSPRLEERSLAGLGYHLSAPESLNWAPADNGGNINGGYLPPTQSRGHESTRPPRRTSRRRNSPSPPPPNGGHDNSGKNCIIPGCPYPAYHNYADQEQTEYCGQGHELHAIATGLVDTCVMCKGRPRRTGEHVCGRTCRERAREARPVQGIYYGVQVTRYDQPRSGA